VCLGLSLSVPLGKGEIVATRLVALQGVGHVVQVCLEGCVALFIDPRVRKIRNEASSCPGIFIRTLLFYYVARTFFLSFLGFEDPT